MRKKIEEGVSLYNTFEVEFLGVNLDVKKSSMEEKIKSISMRIDKLKKKLNNGAEVKSSNDIIEID